MRRNLRQLSGADIDALNTYLAIEMLLSSRRTYCERGQELEVLHIEVYPARPGETFRKGTLTRFEQHSIVQYLTVMSKVCRGRYKLMTFRWHIQYSSYRSQIPGG